MSQPPGWIPRAPGRPGRAFVARKVWAAAGAAAGGGLLVALFVDSVDTGFEYVNTGRVIVAGVVLGPVLLLAAAGLLVTLGERVVVPPLSRLLLWVTATAAGFCAGLAMSYEVTGPPPQDMGKAVASPQAAFAAIFLGVAIAVAVYLSVRPVRIAETAAEQAPRDR